MLHNFKVGDYARNIESGWLGKIEELEEKTVKVDDDNSYAEVIARMIGVDVMAHVIAGLPREESLSPDDIQWHALSDLVPPDQWRRSV